MSSIASHQLPSSLHCAPLDYSLRNQGETLLLHLVHSHQIRSTWGNCSWRLWSWCWPPRRFTLWFGRWFSEIPSSTWKMSRPAATAVELTTWWTARRKTATVISSIRGISSSKRPPGTRRRRYRPAHARRGSITDKYETKTNPTNCHFVMNSVACRPFF